MSTFKDLFSIQSGDYAKFRPTYPKELFEYLASISREKNCAWDCGTGNGQAAIELAKYFKQVKATDPSEKQIAQAAAAPNIDYSIGRAEDSKFADQSFDLITVAQAFHWLKQTEFFAEVKRVAKPGGHLGFWCYELAEVTTEIDQEVMKLYKGTLGTYWEKERSLVEEGYQNVRLPFREINAPTFRMSAEWSAEHFIGYLSTWSALQTYIQKNQSNPLEDFFPGLKKLWGSQPRTVHWKLAARIAQI